MEKFDKARLMAIASDLIISSQDTKATPEEAIVAFAMAMGNLIACHKDSDYAYQVALHQIGMSATGCAKRIGKIFIATKNR